MGQKDSRHLFAFGFTFEDNETQGVSTRRFMETSAELITCSPTLGFVVFRQDDGVGSSIPARKTLPDSLGLNRHIVLGAQCHGERNLQRALVDHEHGTNRRVRLYLLLEGGSLLSGVRDSLSPAPGVLDLFVCGELGSFEGRNTDCNKSKGQRTVRDVKNWVSNSTHSH